MVDNEVSKRLWDVANGLWANTGLRPSQFSAPVLGLIFLRFAERTFAAIEADIGPVGSGSRRIIAKADYHHRKAIFLPEEARWGNLQGLPESADLGKALNDAMKSIEDENEGLAGALPRTFTDIPNSVLVELMRALAPIKLTGDAFGKIYEYFLGEFALAEGQKGGVFYTPESIVDLIVEIIEPFDGRIFDPACGSGGMFVHSAEFAARAVDDANGLSVYGIEKDSVTVNLNRMNLAVHGLDGDVREANSYYDRHTELFPHVAAEGGFDYVMANPPFNVSNVDKGRLEKDPRFPFGLPSTNNANYLWIQLFYSALNETGRAGFVMANSAGDARGSEAAIREKLIETGAVDVICSVGPNMFYTVTLPCTLWFFDRCKAMTDRADHVLFLDARRIFEQVDCAHRRFTSQQIEFLANVVRLWRGEDLCDLHGSDALLAEHGLADGYVDVVGLCKVATRAEIAAQGGSLNPGRYVGTAVAERDGIEFEVRLADLLVEFQELTDLTKDLEESIKTNAFRVLRGAM